MKFKLLIKTFLIVSGFSFSQFSNATTADNIMEACAKATSSPVTSLFSITTCGPLATALAPLHALSTSMNEVFKTNLAQADLLSRKALSGLPTTAEERTLLESTLHLLAENQIISADAAVTGENGLSIEQLNLIVGVSGVIQSIVQE